jgi:2,4-dienoyl-CoA reductase-like NADH-dependent reductase (Old Yellow Enzyme family)
MPMFPRLFAPGRIGSLTVPNRVVFAATSSGLVDKNGFVGDDLVEYYAERARGGTGLLIVEATYVEQEGKRLHHNAMLQACRDHRTLHRLQWVHRHRSPSQGLGLHRQPDGQPRTGA